jgi:hypothetical protein
LGVTQDSSVKIVCGTPNKARAGLRVAFVLMVSVAALGLFSHAKADQPLGAAVAVLDNVTIVDTRNGSLHPHKAILIRDGKIAKIVPAHTLKTLAASVDLHGKFVVPGYLDLHNHALNSPGPEISLSLMVANGITGYRQMAGSPQLLAARKNGTLPHPNPSPQLLAMPGSVLAGPWKSDVQAAVAEVDTQKAEGADFIKTVDQTHDAFFAALDRAHADGLAFGGHLPPSVDVREAAHRGMWSVEHLGPNGGILEACSTDEAAIRQDYAQSPPPAEPINFSLPLSALKRLTANPLLLLTPGGFARIQHILDTYSDKKCRALAKELAATATWQVPTLIRLKAMEFGDDVSFANNPNLHYVLHDDRELWLQVSKDFTAKITPANRQTLKQLFAAQLRLVKLFSDAGVKMTAGTDFGGQWLVAGFSLHQEFDLLAQAGISPLKILQMTTLDGAKMLHREATMGTVDAGKDADLVILDANPVANVRNLHRIDAVVRGGVYYSRDALDEIEQREIQP